MSEYQTQVWPRVEPFTTTSSPPSLCACPLKNSTMRTYSQASKFTFIIESPPSLLPNFSMEEVTESREADGQLENCCLIFLEPREHVECDLTVQIMSQMLSLH